MWSRFTDIRLGVSLNFSSVDLKVYVFLGVRWENGISESTFFLLLLSRPVQSWALAWESSGTPLFTHLVA